ncbi:MAG: 23S rRNA (pseudouridine(1915)-N(3))-methyltransferase RlmH [candidate division Zixibacteria bacterium]|nr:23S rRNA (pseudouridine(1915)-N(3))-methyltransferase RlmH [candidate division Zixibacteria bacterium]
MKRLETDKLEKNPGDCYLLALADSGIKVYSFTFAKNLEKLSVRSSNEFKIVIGGPYGLDHRILKK